MNDASAALVLEPGYAKAHYRRACARERLHDPISALTDAEDAHRLTPESQETADLCASLRKRCSLLDGKCVAQIDQMPKQLNKATASLPVNLAVQQIKGEGQGLIAAEKIAAGTEILAEMPFVALPEKQQHDKVWPEQEHACRMHAHCFRMHLLSENEV